MTAGFCDYGCLGTLSIDGVALNTPAWDVSNPIKLLAEATVRGSNTVLPGAPGQRANIKRLDAHETDLAFLITGDVDRFGTPYTDPWAGLEANLAYLWTNVFQPSLVATRAAVYVTVGGVTRTAAVQVEPLHLPNEIDDPTLVEAVLHLTIPAGRFA